MTSEQRIDKLEEGFLNIDKRQETFETYTRERIDSFEKFVKGYIEKTDQMIVEQRERMDRMDTRMDKMDQRMDKFEEKMDKFSDRIHNLFIATIVGVATIVVTVFLTR
jgi:uncharacterized coiled-coil protein SlyX